VEGDFSGGGIDEDAAGFEDGFGVAGASAEKCPDPGEEFGEVEGFDQIIIGARVEAADAVGGGIAGREEEDGSVFSGAQCCEDGKAVEFRQHEVDDQGIVLGFEGFVEGIGAGGGGIHGVTLVAECECEAAKEVGFVFCDKEAHGVMEKRLGEAT
jgi:hypothetical protein